IRIPDDKVFGFASDTNTFISRPAADTFAFTNGGTEKVRIDSSGRMMIGNTAAGQMYSGADNLVIGNTSGENGITIISQ
ncbi:MAG: hypothetical protein VXY93_22050, partial [Pseudomonadota bacterium]|nr:hypothetical protein [Pseudomonadota bacterium]